MLFFILLNDCAINSSEEREVVWRPLTCSLERLDMIYSVHAIVCVLFLIVALKGANSHSYTLHDGLNTDFFVCV